MPDIKTTLTRRIGPLPVWAWGAVGVTGVGLGLYLRARSARGAAAPVDATGAIVDSGAALPVDVTGRLPTPTDGGLAGEPVPTDWSLPEPVFPDPFLAECPDGMIMDIFGRCVPDPNAMATPSEGPDKGAALRARLAKINARLAHLRAGGIKPAERPKVKTLRRRRQRIRGLLG